MVSSAGKEVNDCIQSTTAVCGNVATVGYNYTCANSDHLYVWSELLGQIEAHYH